MPAQNGTKKITGEKPFGVYVYGYGYADSYGYIGGMKFENIEEILPGTSRDRTICEGDTVQMHVYGASDIAWFPSENLSCSDCPDPFVLVSEDQTYYVEYSDYLGCIYFDSVQVKVLVRPIPDLGDDLIICDEGSVELDAGTDAESYEWTPRFGLSCTDCRYPTASPTNTTTYTLKASNGKCYGLDTVKVTVGKSPELTMQNNYQICEGDTAFVEVETYAQEITWFPDIDISCTDCRDPKIFPTETRYYYIEAISSDGCVKIDSVLIEVYPLPQLSITAPDSICPGEPFNMNANGAINYKWSPEIGLSCSECSDPEVILFESRMYYLEGENQNGCISYDSIFIAVKDRPQLNVIPEYQVCLNEEVELLVSGADNYRWYPSDGLSCNDCPDPTLIADRDLQFTVIGWNEDLCYDTAFVNILTKPCQIEIQGIVDFGNVLLCNSLISDLQIVNDNPAEIEIYNLSISGLDEEAFSIEEPNKLRVIPENSTLNVPVEFNPQKTGISNAILEVTSSIDSLIYVDLQGEAYLTNAFFELKNNSVLMPNDTLEFTVSSNIDLLNEVEPIEMSFKVKYDPYVMHFINEYQLNEGILDEWEIDAQSFNISSRTNHYIQFDLKGEVPLIQNGDLFSFKTLVLLSNLDSFSPELEATLNEKELLL
jgi:hypothetical protein